MAFGDFVQGVFTDNPGSPSGVSVGTVTAGNLLIAAFGRATNSTPTVADSLGVNTWAIADSHYDAAEDYRIDIWWTITQASGACTITITAAGGAGEAARAEYQGPFAAAPLDQAVSANGNSASASSGTVTPSVSGELGVGYHVVREPNAFTSTGSWVTDVDGNVASNGATILQSQVRADVSAFAATASLTSGLWSSIVATFAPAEATGSGGLLAYGVAA